MTADRHAIERLIGRYRYPGWLRLHSLLVRDVAAELAAALAVAGSGIDVALVEAGAALHDIGRSPLLEGDERPHHERSALILAAEGLGDLAEIARRHVVFAIREPDLAPRTLEERVVYYADRRAGLAVLSLDDRLREQAVRFPRWAAEILACAEPARALERELFAGLEIRPGDLHAAPTLGNPA